MLLTLRGFGASRRFFACHHALQKTFETKGVRHLLSVGATDRRRCSELLKHQGHLLRIDGPFAISEQHRAEAWILPIICSDEAAVLGSLPLGKLN